MDYANFLYNKTMKNKQTAVDWLEEKMIVSGFLIPIPFVEQAKQIEKEQIMNANKDGFAEAFGYMPNQEVVSPEQYYNETYGK